MNRVLLPLALGLVIIFFTVDVHAGERLPNIPSAYLAEKDRDAPPDISAGLKAGIGINSINGDETFKKGFLPGFVGGAFIEVARNKIGVQIEGLFSLASYQLQDTFLSGGRLQVMSIEIPILLKYNILKRLSVIAGPQFTTIMGVSHNPPTKADPRQLFLSGNISGVAGVEVKLLKQLSVGARYLVGFSDVNNVGYSVSTQRWTTSAVQVSASVKLN